MTRILSEHVVRVKGEGIMRRYFDRFQPSGFRVRVRGRERGDQPKSATLLVRVWVAVM